MLRILSCFALVALLLGCSIAGSELPDQLNGRARPEGVLYSLPRGVVTITLAVEEKRARFFLNVSDPEFIADPNHRYLLQHRPLPNFEDELKIKVNRRTFLTSVESTSTDRTGDIVLNIVRAARGGVAPLQELDLSAADFMVLAELTIDPTDQSEFEHAVSALNERVASYARERARRCDPSGGDGGEEAADGCIEYKRLAERARRNVRIISLSISRTAPLVLSKPADCTVGVCYRIANPYRISYSFAGGGIVQKIVELPNENPPIEIDLKRAFLVKKVQKIEFGNDGHLKEVSVSKPSELLELSKLPLEITKAVLSAPAEALKLRIETTNQQKGLAESQAQLLQAQQALANARAPAVRATGQQESDTGEDGGPVKRANAGWATNGFTPVATGAAKSGGGKKGGAGAGEKSSVFK